MAQGTATATSASSAILAADEFRDFVTIQSTSTTDMALGFDTDAVAGEGIQLLQAGDTVTVRGYLARGAINFIGNNGTIAYQTGPLVFTSGATP